MADRKKKKGNRDHEQVPRGDHNPRDASGGRSEGGYGGTSGPSGRGRESRTDSGTSSSDRERSSHDRDDDMRGSARGQGGANRDRGMGASQGSEQNRSDRLSGRSEVESDREERNAGSKPGWDERSSDL
jgi:hypothetical protein